MSLLDKPEIIIASYQASEWNRWQSEMSDGASFFAGSFEEWQLRVQSTYNEYTRQGNQVFMIPITIDEFIPWAERNGRTRDAEARSEYAGLNVGQMRVS